MKAVETLDPREAEPSASGQRAAYHSPLRERQAAETRERIQAAAMELFAEHGFRGTTIAAIARRAVVSAPTIYAAFGSKGAILTALMAQFETAADVAEWHGRITAERDPAGKLRLFAQWSAALFTGSRAVILAAADAIGDPALVELKAEGDRRRRQGVGALIDELAGIDALRPGLTRATATDRAWALSGLELYLATTVDCDWTPDAYAEWLGELLVSQLLKDHPGA